MRAAASATLRRLEAVRWPSLPGRPVLPAHAGRWAIGLTAAAVLLAAGYLLWFRDSSLVRVEKVRVEGLSTKDAPRIRKALSEAGRDMTTLHVRPDELAKAVSAYPAVSSVQATTDFPHGLRITVVEQSPAAMLVLPGGDKVAVAADGTVLEGVEGHGRLAQVALGAPVPGARLRDPEALGYVRVAAAAPAALATEVLAIEQREGGDIVARLRAGPQLVFGDGARLEAKWAAAAAALADGSSAEAGYVDLRLPERPAVGGASPQP